MKKTYIITGTLAILLFTACGDITSQLEQKQQMLNDKMNQLDSMVNTEVKKVQQLDTLIQEEKATLDSLLNIERVLLSK
jgi:uncharacterized phage infection (PIP) family protein YhgE